LRNGAQGGNGARCYVIYGRIPRGGVDISQSTGMRDSTDIKTVEAFSLLMMRINANLDDSVAMVRDEGSPEELQWYRQEVGKITGDLYLDIEERLLAEPPSLRPREMKGDYIVDPSNFEPRFYAIRRDSDM
jgi:hypothetical protein